MTSIDGKNYYELLGVEREATKEQIRDAYKEIARVFHPDSHFYDEILESAGVSSNEDQKFKVITEAYNTLCNERRRKEYDQSLLGPLPKWDQDMPNEWHANHRAEKSPISNDETVAPFAYGYFGKVSRDPESAFDNAELNSVRAMSQMMHVKRGQFTLFGRMFGWLFKR